MTAAAKSFLWKLSIYLFKIAHLNNLLQIQIQRQRIQIQRQQIWIPVSYTHLTLPTTPYV